MYTKMRLQIDLESYVVKIFCYASAYRLSKWWAIYVTGSRSSIGGEEYIFEDKLFEDHTYN